MVILNNIELIFIISAEWTTVVCRLEKKFVRKTEGQQWHPSSLESGSNKPRMPRDSRQDAVTITTASGITTKYSDLLEECPPPKCPLCSDVGARAAHRREFISVVSVLLAALALHRKCDEILNTRRDKAYPFPTRCSYTLSSCYRTHYHRRLNSLDLTDCTPQPRRLAAAADTSDGATGSSIFWTVNWNFFRGRETLTSFSLRASAFTFFSPSSNISIPITELLICRFGKCAFASMTPLFAWAMTLAYALVLPRKTIMVTAAIL